MSRGKFNLDKITKVLSDNDENWQPRMKGLVDLEKYVTKNSNDMKVLTKDFFRQLRIPMQKQLQDLRSSIVREACKAITSIAINGNSNGCIVIDFCLPNIIEVSAGANKVMATYASKCLWSTLKLCEEGSKQVIHTLVDSACHSKNTRIRENAMEGICIVVENWETLSERDGEEIFTALRSGYEDASAKTRAKAREAFWPYNEHFHESANTLLGIMDSRQKRTILNIKPSPSDMNNKNKNSKTNNGKNLKINTALNKTMRIKPSSNNNTTKKTNSPKQIKKHVIKIQSPRSLPENENDDINDNDNKNSVVVNDINKNVNVEQEVQEEEEEEDDDDDENTTHQQQRYNNNVTIMDDTMTFDDLINDEVDETINLAIDVSSSSSAAATANNNTPTLSNTTNNNNNNNNNNNMNDDDDTTLPLENVAELLKQATTEDENISNNASIVEKAKVDTNNVVDEEITFNTSKEAWTEDKNNNINIEKKNDESSNLQPLSRKETEKIIDANNEEKNIATSNITTTINDNNNNSGLIIQPTNSLDPNMSTTEIGLHLLHNHRSHVDQVLAILRKEMEILGQFEQKETIKATDVALYASNIADAMHERETLLESMYNLLGETCSSLK